MRRLLSVCFVLAATCPAHAQQKPNTLTPKEIADGWILLFDGETTFGWKTDPRQISDGVIMLQGPGEAIFMTGLPEEAEVIFGVRGKGSWGAESTSPGGKGSSRLVGIDSVDWATLRLLMHADANSPSNKSGAHIEFDYRIGDQWGQTWKHKHDFIAASHRVVFKSRPGEKLELRSIKARSRVEKRLFNGTDLTGWKAFPGDKYKSKFAVVDNAINVKDGPGDLQTVGKYKDFILQLECKSNGKHLNSGIFFRCRDNEYQNGYECQIRNQFTKEATQKYTIEDFDPMTNKLLGKRDIMSTAVDYGTGAIYRRVPARKEMAKDGEWFGLTIVAHGNHFATWVNGVQVVDWTDNRPRDDNARKGCCLNAGHVSIQGHDPTTDLSFRNIRIAEFK